MALLLLVPGLVVLYVAGSILLFQGLQHGDRRPKSTQLCFMAELVKLVIASSFYAAERLQAQQQQKQVCQQQQLQSKAPQAAVKPVKGDVEEAKDASKQHRGSKHWPQPQSAQPSSKQQKHASTLETWLRPYVLFSLPAACHCISNK